MLLSKANYVRNLTWVQSEKLSFNGVGAGPVSKVNCCDEPKIFEFIVQRD